MHIDLGISQEKDMNPLHEVRLRKEDVMDDKMLIILDLIIKAT